jgi:hypothetical protein
MAELAHGTQPEFWRPPVPKVDEQIALREAGTLAEVCPRCNSEYLLGSRFCHSCGGRRPEAISALTKSDSPVTGMWDQTLQRLRGAGSRFSLQDVGFPEWLHYLSFHEIKSQVGLSTASFVAFLIGLGCLTGALLVGFLTVKTLGDWQAIQFYRAEWLLGATASFVAGILLKKNRNND